MIEIFLMPAKKKAAPKKQKSFEESLWDTATKLRGSVESSDWSGATEATRQGYPEGERGGANQYKHTAKRGSAFSDGRWRRRTPRTVRGAEDNVLSLIFLKLVSWRDFSKAVMEGKS
jgi:hypothetical protein